jgi:hypothetical protein
VHLRTGGKPDNRAATSQRGLTLFLSSRRETRNTGAPGRAYAASGDGRQLEYIFPAFVRHSGPYCSAHCEEHCAKIALQMIWSRSRTLMLTQRRWLFPRSLTRCGWNCSIFCGSKVHPQPCAAGRPVAWGNELSPTPAGAVRLIEQDARDSRRERWWRHREQKVSLADRNLGVIDRAATAHLLAEPLAREAHALDRDLAARKDVRFVGWHDSPFFMSRALRLTPSELTSPSEGIESLVDGRRRPEEPSAREEALPVRVLTFAPESMQEEE